MKELTIGQWVRVSAVSCVEYHDMDRVIARREVIPFKAMIVGKAVKQLGRYHKESGGSPFGDDYDPPYLSISGTMTVWLVRAGMMNREILVQDADLEACPPATLPTRAVNIAKSLLVEDACA